MIVKATNKITGEIIELKADSLSDVIAAWRVAQEYTKTATALQDQLKKIVPSLVSDRGTSDQVGSFIFRVMTIQRMNYDKSVMREVLDADLYDTLIQPNKTLIDKYLKENVGTTGDTGTTLRKTMLPTGNSYTVIKLEKVTRDE